VLQWYYLALLSSVILGLYTIVEKVALKREHATAFSSAFSFVAAILALPFLVFADFSGITALQYALIFVNGIVIALTYLMAARVYRHGSLSTASAAFSSLPSVFVVILAFSFLGERLTWLQYLSVIVIVLVTYSLLFDRRRADQFDGNKYRTMVVTRSFLVAVQALLAKYLLSVANVNVFALFVLSEIFVAVDFAVFISVKYNGVKEILGVVRQYSLPILAMALLTLGYGLTYYLSLLGAPVSLVTPVRNTVYAVITVLIGGLLFKEDDMRRKVALCAVLLIFAYLLIA
jgi:transporter family protein